MASFDTSGNIDTNSRCPPRSQICPVSCGYSLETYGERDFRIADGYCLLHEVDTKRLDVILTDSSVICGHIDSWDPLKAAFDVFDHQGCLANLRVAYHSDFEDDATV